MQSKADLRYPTKGWRRISRVGSICNGNLGPEALILFASQRWPIPLLLADWLLLIAPSSRADTFDVGIRFSNWHRIASFPQRKA